MMVIRTNGSSFRELAIVNDDDKVYNIPILYVRVYIYMHLPLL